MSISAKFVRTSGEELVCDGNEISLPAGSAGTWIITIRNDGSEISVPATFRLERYNIQLAGKLQNTHPKRRDYVSCDSPDDMTVSVSPVGNGDKSLAIALEAGTWNTGREVEVRIGDRRDGGYGSEVFWTTTRGRLTLVRESAGGIRERTAEDFFVNVTDRDEVALLRLLAPTTVRPNTPFDLHAVAFDINRNVVERFTGELLLTCDGPVNLRESTIRFEHENKGIRIIEGIELETEGVFRFTVTAADEAADSAPSAVVNAASSPKAVSNPIVCRANGKSVFWGDLHNHGWGDSTMLLMHDRIEKITPENRHLQARRVGRFDYAAVGAMSMPDDEGRKEIWEDYRKTVKKLDEPGRYVPFLGMEMHPDEGDRMLFFRDDAEIPLPKKTPAPEVYKAYAGRPDAILECHIGGSSPKYGKYAPDNEELIEVTSAFGNAEWLLQKMLRRGYTPAITGASDMHLGLLGAPRAVETFRGRFGYRGKRLGFRDSGFGSGPIGALVADRLERDSLWNALRSRSGYATTGDRIFIEVDANGHVMGEIAGLPDAFDLSITVYGESEIERIDLIVGEYLARSFRPGARDFQTVVSYDRSEMPPGTWFYFRVRQVNNEYGWSAPIWFADGRSKGDTGREWPAWNRALRPPVSDDPELRHHLDDLESYLETHGDRGFFGRIDPVGIRHESMGTAALFVTEAAEESHPLSIRWFFDFEIPKLRVDWGYEPFGVVDCEHGPAGEPK